MTTVKTATVDSPLGPLTLTAVDGCLTGLHMSGRTHGPSSTEGWEADDRPFAGVKEQLAAYFAGDLTDFDVPLCLQGTPFQVRVWEQLRRIPFGDTWSYAELAAEVGNPRACRAVGLANGRNPVSIIVPCHRVIASDGSLGGYGGGLDRKQLLLRHEQSVLAAAGAAAAGAS